MKKKIMLILALAVTALLLVSCAASGNADAAQTTEAAGGNSIWDLFAIPLGFIMKYCYIFANDVLGLPRGAYLIALFLFAFITKLLMLPLSIKQQRSQAQSAVFQPMVAEIQKKYKNNREKAEQELQKLQTEYGYSPTAGCGTMFIQFPIIFGLVEVIYKPLRYMLFVPEALLNKICSITATHSGLDIGNRLIQTKAIELIKSDIGLFSSLMNDTEAAATIQKIADLDMSIGSINLWEIPTFSFSLIVLIPLFSIVTMLLSTYVSMKVSGSLDANGAKTGMSMLVVSSLLFGVFSFTYPAGFSLYWGFQNLILIAQSILLRKICDPEKLKKEYEAKIEAKKKEKKAAKKVRIKTESGEIVEKEIPAAELARMRLQKAREIDEIRYN